MLTASAASGGNGQENTPINSTQLPTQTLPPVSTTKPEKCLGESKQNSINIRSGPSGSIVGCCLAEMEKVEIQRIDASGEWVLIKGIDRPSHQGWVKMSFLNIIGNCEMVVGQ